MSTQEHTHTEEEQLGKSYDGRLMRRLLQYLKPYKRKVLLAAGLLLVTSLFALTQPLITQYAIDHYILAGNYSGLVLITALFVALSGINFVFEYLHFYIMQMTGQYIMYDMRKQVFSHLQGMQLSFFNKNPIGRLVTRLTTDIDSLNDMFTSGVVTILGDILLLMGLVSLMLYYDVRLALITLSVMPLLFVTAFLFKKKVRESFRIIRVLIARINSFLQENITGMKIVQLFNRENKNYQQFERINADHLKAYMKTIFYFSVFFPTVEVLSAVAIALIIWYGGGFILTEELTYGQLVAFILAAQKFYRPIQDLSEKYNVLQSAMASSERVFALLDTSEEIPESEYAADLSDLKGDIEFKNVWFAYKEDDWVLRDVSFSVKQGEKVAIVGATGAGKSTIINLLSRFYTLQKGVISVDGNNIEDVTMKSLRRNIGVVLQDVFLFSGTVRENITLGKTDFTETEIISAARDVHAHQFISKLEKGYDEEVRERGSNFSTGQKQLISFARALMYDPKVLVLDEATSNIDTETEILIQKALNRLMLNRTSIVVAHRLSTIKNVDRIIVIHKGKIREEGSHRELLQNRGLYHKLYQLQYREQERAAEALANGVTS